MIKRLAIAVLCLLVLTSCGGKKASKTTPATTPDGNVVVAPLTGEPSSSKDIAKRSVITVKIDNAPAARPQFGIQLADDFVEEKVEGGISRFMVIFQSKDSEKVGPVRSVRDTDVSWLKPLGGMLTFSGGIDPVKARIQPAGLLPIDGDRYEPKYLKRLPGRTDVHSMYTNTSLIRNDFTPKQQRTITPLYQYLKPGETFGGDGAKAISSFDARLANIPTAAQFSWTWDAASGKFLRKSDGKVHEIKDVGQIAMPNVILQFVSYARTAWHDASGAPVDQAIVNGEGDAWMYADGKVVKGRWSRPTNDSITTFRDRTGAPIKFKPGQTWLTLVPTGTQVNEQ